MPNLFQLPATPLSDGPDTISIAGLEDLKVRYIVQGPELASAIKRASTNKAPRGLHQHYRLTDPATVDTWGET